MAEHEAVRSARGCVSHMSDLQTAWVAGIFEGEGCIHLDKRGAIHVRVKMSDKDVIERLCQITRIGTFRRETMSRTNKKSTWAWSVTAVAEGFAILSILSPWFGKRRYAKAQEALGILKHKLEVGRFTNLTKRTTTANGTKVCNRGHLLTPANVYEYRGYKNCRKCRQHNERKRRRGNVAA